MLVHTPSMHHPSACTIVVHAIGAPVLCALCCVPSAMGMRGVRGAAGLVVWGLLDPL